MYIHGDIDIKPVSKIPRGSKIIGKTVAEGETTGHKHSLKGSAQVLEYAGERYIQVLEPAQITHQEHKPIELNPGVYKIEIEKEYSWFTEEIRKVRD